MAESKWIYANKSTRNISAFVIGLGLLGTALFLVLGRRFGLDARPGFFGTYAPLYSDINLVVEILMVLGLITGYILIRNKLRSGHQYMQTSMVLLNLVMTIFFMALIFVQLLQPGTTLSLSVIAEIAHGTAGVISILTGLYLLLAMNGLLPKSWQIKNWKGLMRFAIWAYSVVALGGIAVYFLFFLGLKF
jgi:uncharacterized membrane protein YozB (DUF420 family)